MFLLVSLTVGAAVKGAGRNATTLEGHGDLTALVQSVFDALLTIAHHHLLDFLVPLALVEENNLRDSLVEEAVKITLSYV